MDLRLLSFLLCSVPWTGGTWTPSYTANWQLPDPANENETCLLLTGDFQFALPYLLETDEVGHATVRVPHHGVENGTCTKWRQQISISWTFPGGLTNNSLVFSFTQNGTRDNKIFPGYFHLFQVRATIHSNPVEFPGAANPGRVFNLSAMGLTRWVAPLPLSYFCDAEEEIPLDIAGAFLRLSRIQVQPFHETPIGANPSEFTIRSYCGADVQHMMTDGLLFIGLLFFVSIMIVFFLHRQRRSSYRPV